MFIEKILSLLCKVFFTPGRSALRNIKTKTVAKSTRGLRFIEEIVSWLKLEPGDKLGKKDKM